jgi:predicted phosphodiesterase
MRIAVIADIHGNMPALEAVLADIERRDADRTINLGDCVCLVRSGHVKSANYSWRRAVQ